jgi:membrane protein DedA with SNARE-associated domain
VSILALAQTAAKAAHHARKHAGHSPIPPWLIHLGAIGVFGVSVVDSSVIPLPLPGSTDLLLLFLVAHGANPWLLAPAAIVGSMIGGYITWSVGRKGGETALRNYISQRNLARISDWVENHSLLAVVLPAILPPPIPLLPFLLAAGALGVSRRRFLIAFGSARAVRYSIVAWLGVKYGRGVVHVWEKYVAEYSKPVLWTLLVVTIGGVAYGIWKLRRMKRAERDSGERQSTLAKEPLASAR